MQRSFSKNIIKTRNTYHSTFAGMVKMMNNVMKITYKSLNCTKIWNNDRVV